MSTYTLNFSLSTDEQRTKYISELCNNTQFTSKQYTQMADYILLGTNTTSTSCIIYPEEFSSPHIIHNEPSLDELMDNPELSDIIDAQIQPISRSIYKKTIRKIDRNNPSHLSIPGMIELWSIIDHYKSELELHPKDYKVKKLLISLYKQQYSLLENYLPIKPSSSYKKQSKQFFPWSKGILLNNGDYADLDLCKPQHMVKFLILLPFLEDYCTDLDCDLAQLLTDVKAALQLTTLTPIQQDILHLYQDDIPIAQIQAYIQQHHNRKLTQAYVSVIMNNQIASKVAYEYSDIYWSRIYKNNPEKWRICLGCKEKKLLTKHNFHRFSNKPGGYALYCKECRAKMNQKPQPKG